MARNAHNLLLRLKVECAALPKPLWYAILGYVLLMSALCVLKYHFFLYDGLDLAIFNQTFWNTVHGRWFEMSVTFPHKYLGDHTGIWLILYLPIYFVFRHPITLLVIQAIVLALASIPVYLIARRIFRDERMAIFWGLLWLVNPYVWNANLFEFHIISIFPLLIFSTVYTYLTQRTQLFIWLLGLTVVTREDMGMITLGLSGVLLLDWLRERTSKKRLWYILTHVVIAALWTMLAYRIVAIYSGIESTRFIRYYAWMGSGVSEIMHTMMTRPIMILRHFFSSRNIQTFIALLLPFCFSPIYRPKWLILGAVPLTAMFLISPLVDTTSFLSLHYVLTSLPAFCLAGIYGHAAFVRRHPRYRNLSILILIIATGYTLVVFGPFSSPDLKNRIEQSLYHRSFWDTYNNTISADDHVLSDLAFLPHLSSRERLYNLDQLYIGTLEFSDAPYGPICDLDTSFLTTSGLGRVVARYNAFPHASFERIEESLACSDIDSYGVQYGGHLAISYRSFLSPTPHTDVSSMPIQATVVTTSERYIMINIYHPENVPDESNLLWRLDTQDREGTTYSIITPYSLTTETKLTVTSHRFLEAHGATKILRLSLVKNGGTNFIDLLQSNQFVLSSPMRVYGGSDLTFRAKKLSQ